MFDIWELQQKNDSLVYIYILSGFLRHARGKPTPKSHPRKLLKIFFGELGILHWGITTRCNKSTLNFLKQSSSIKHILIMHVLSNRERNVLYSVITTNKFHAN